MHRGRLRRRGMSLMEVLVALTVFLMALAAIGQLVDIGTDDALAANANNAATRLAQSKLAEVEAGAVPVTGASSGNFDTETEWSWSVEPTATDVANVYSVTVRVSRVVRNRNVEVTLTQMMLDPQMMGGATETSKPTTPTTTTPTTTASGSTTK